MKQDIAVQWVAALRSGDYEQGIGQLRNSNGDRFCCLGVLCNLHAQANPEIAKTQEHIEHYLGQSSIIPEDVKLWAGMYSQVGIVNSSDIGVLGHPSLIDANDRGVSFKRIATFIEKNYKHL